MRISDWSSDVCSSDLAGPAVTVAFMLAALACALAIVCYAEFASTIPVAGSAYTYTYATPGAFMAWIIGWALLLELLTAAAVIAKARKGGVAGQSVSGRLERGGRRKLKNKRKYY